MRSSIVKRAMTWLLGSRDKPFEYTHHAVLLIGSIVYFYCALANYLFDLASMSNILLQLVLSPVVLLFGIFHVGVITIRVWPLSSCS